MFIMEGDNSRCKSLYDEWNHKTEDYNPYYSYYDNQDQASSTFFYYFSRKLNEY